MIGIIVAFIMFMLLVVSHEFGHFIMAKLFKVRVNEFSVGMGPLIYEKTKGETQYSLRAIPIGGYCRLEGDVEDGDSEDPASFNQ
ncbi:MAG: site-2 protease family protein, partial [Firmicutes bacterium]|nr:site-2 protease family protein [Bacillota bacterium]